MSPPLHDNLKRQWRSACAAFLLLLVWILFLYWDTAIGMVTIWMRSETFTHGFIVPPIVAWLVWRQRHAIGKLAPRPAAGVLVAIAGISFVWLLGDLVATNSVTQLAFVALLVAVVPAVFGIAVARLIIFPLGFLFFAVPIGEFLMPQLMAWTADFTVVVLRLSGIPVYREGLQFVIPSGNWSVVEACSGVRYLIASLTVGTLFAYLNYRSTKRRLLFVLVSLAVPILANWMRAYLIVLLGHLSGNKLATGVDHLIYGWLFFGVVILLMFFVGAKWAEVDAPAPSAVQTQDKAAEPPLATHFTRQLWLTVVGLAVVMGLPQLELWNIQRHEAGEFTLALKPESLVGKWSQTPAAEPQFKPAFQNPAAELNASFAEQDKLVGLYLGYYHNQRYDSKLVSSNNVLVISKDRQWAQVSSGGRVFAPGENAIAVKTAELLGSALGDQAGDKRLVVWQFYWINGNATSSDYLAKIYGAFYRLIGRGDESAVVIVYARKSPGADPNAVLESFLSTNYAAINDLLSKAVHRVSR